MALLESLRGLAALYVFLGHLFRQTLMMKAPVVRFAWGFGQEAVMLFFLLSGFVIYYSYADRSDITFKEYFARRFARIYPIFLAGLALAYVATCFEHGAFVNPQARTLVGNLLMLQDSGPAYPPNLWFDVYMKNYPLWSLSYEWWFYMLFFAIYFRADQKWRLPIVAVLSIGGSLCQRVAPNEIAQILSYLIIWWSGAELARGYIERSWPDFRIQIPSLVILVVCLALRTPHGALQSFAKGAHGLYPFNDFWHLTTAAAFVVLALCLGRKGVAAIKKLVMPFMVLAPISYGLYVTHATLIFHGDWLSQVAFAPRVALYIAVALILAYLAEVPYQRYMSRLIVGHLIKRRQPREGVHV